MSELWRILLVEDNDVLNQSIVNSLRKDGYVVHGVRSGAEAIRIVWSEEFDVVIGDLKTPGADGFEMLQWLRAFRPKTRMIMIAASGSAMDRTQALEAGVVSYLSKPLDLHLLKEELRRLLQHTGFSASLDSFDLLDVIQIITMSRKSIALLVNTGLEERGILRFQGGELIWAEYGILRGEEAFFALAAHKNGTVIHQPWNEQITPNVTQPLSRLIFQALQYRSKYAAMQQSTGEYEVIQKAIVHSMALSTQDLNDDRPFLTGEMAQGDGIDKVFQEYVEDEEMVSISDGNNGNNGSVESNEATEWWQQPLRMPNASKRNGDIQTSDDPSLVKSVPDALPIANVTNITPSTVHKTAASQRADLPSWLMEQPTDSGMPKLHPSSLSTTAHGPAAQPAKPSPAEWQANPPPRARTTIPLPRKQSTGAQKPLPKATGKRSSSSPEWQSPEQETPPNGHLQNLARARKTSGAMSLEELLERDTPTLTNMHKLGTHQPTKRNYSNLIAALQTVGYSISGFIATAVASFDGQPIAQVTIDDIDISQLCSYFSNILQGVLMSLKEENGGDYEDTVITSADRHILLRIVSSDKEAFHVLITTRESKPSESLEVMAHVDAAIVAALH
jgi:DNA-binding response OmpR family regulator/predicted regulator of Ras-like GTPase activity (Roadblock/LC7/MglB family)